MSITYRWLEASELSKIDPVFEDQGWTPLNENTSRVLVAEDNGKIVGFSVMQLYPHAEPLFVEPDYHGTGVAEQLADRMQKWLKEINCRGYEATATHPVVERLCKERGMTLVKYPIYRA